VKGKRKIINFPATPLKEGRETGKRIKTIDVKERRQTLRGGYPLTKITGKYSFGRRLLGGREQKKNVAGSAHTGK